MFPSYITVLFVVASLLKRKTVSHRRQSTLQNPHLSNQKVEPSLSGQQNFLFRQTTYANSSSARLVEYLRRWHWLSTNRCYET
jgi:hypothetical protein